MKLTAFLLIIAIDILLFLHILSIQDEIYDYTKPQYSVGDTVLVHPALKKVIIIEKKDKTYVAENLQTDQRIELYIHEIRRMQ